MLAYRDRVVHTVAAYLYVTDNDVDPNTDLSMDQLNHRLEEASHVVAGAKELIRLMPSLESKNSEEIQYEFYEVAKRFGGESGSEIRGFFKRLYQICFHKESGPRWGQFVDMLGPIEYARFLERKLQDPFGFRP
jgi:lysyl-tRNA synthetase class I